MFQWVSAEVLQQRGDLDEALKAIRESVKLLDTSEGKMDVRRTMSLAHVLIWEGRILGQDNGLSLGRWEAAAASFDRAFRITDAVVHQDPYDQSSRGRLAIAGTGLAGALRRSDAGRALAVYEHTLRHLAEIRGNAVIDRAEAEALAGSAYPLRRIGRSPEARRRLDAAFDRLTRLKLYPSEKITPGSVTDKALRALADHEAANRNIPRAIDIYQKLLDQMRAAKVEPETSLEDAVDLSSVYQAITGLHRRNYEPGRADAISALRLELWRNWDRKLPGNACVRRQLEAAAQP
jgi:tetratricopeptide (TPR) repeat protein